MAKERRPEATANPKSRGIASRDVRKTLHPHMTAADMGADGKRWCMLHTYGGPFDQKSVEYAMMAWNVDRWWLINPTGLTANRVPKITTDGGPEYMLLFADGKWRYASFGGLNGPPCASCWWEGFEAPNGESAYRIMIIERKIRRVTDLQEQAKALMDEVVEIQGLLEASRKHPERGDERWSKK